MKESDFQRLKGSVQEMVDAELDSPNSLQDKMSELEGRGFQRINDPRSNTLTEVDLQRLEKVGFRVHWDSGEYPDPLAVEDEAGRLWDLGIPIDAALIGVLVGMARERGISVMSFGSRHHPPAKRSKDQVAYNRNATPRQIFDALIEVLEATDETTDD